jgi:hypothetical protein
MPPPWMRRPVTVTVWLVLSVLFLALSPLLLLVGALAARLTGRPQPAMLAQLAVAYFARELAVMLACAALWVASAGGALIDTERFQLLHWRLLRWFVQGIAGLVRSMLRVTLREEPSSEAIEALQSTEPLIVLSRHAGRRHDLPGRSACLALRPAAEHRLQADTGGRSKHRLDRASPAARGPRTRRPRGLRSSNRSGLLEARK